MANLYIESLYSLAGARIFVQNSLEKAKDERDLLCLIKKGHLEIS